MTPTDLREILALVGQDITFLKPEIRLLLLKTPTTEAEKRLQQTFLAQEIERILKGAGHSPALTP